MTLEERRKRFAMAAKAYANVKPETREERLQREEREIREMMEQCKRGYWPREFCR